MIMVMIFKRSFFVAYFHIFCTIGVWRNLCFKLKYLDQVIVSLWRQREVVGDQTLCMLKNSMRSKALGDPWTSSPHQNAKSIVEVRFKPHHCCSKKWVEFWWVVFLLSRLRASRVLLVGIKGLGAEICKNLVLSGVKSLTIVDPHPVNEEDFVSQFLVQRQDLGKNVSVFNVYLVWWLYGRVKCDQIEFWERFLHSPLH